ncbi:uncharacterized protein PHALS_14342 [Plasmopara halstedii]|uniref:Uncharacterized protein n=1 Tax=Plasmopara halstedii TaxID=4781 RepID=A0A0P1ARZ9_PLAHL|nr:uncharacterized protein PHALS_14342 [Plasmopara halstedii]CEG44074.1 hypothetical protein PHALS_14342 [Plasmopara halstedii]|eukprot:XP_024580443.1 hypothetical protein PHALS_14342 [Plasmopara halstedii]
MSSVRRLTVVLIDVGTFERHTLPFRTSVRRRLPSSSPTAKAWVESSNENLSNSS